MGKLLVIATTESTADCFLIVLALVLAVGLTLLVLWPEPLDDEDEWL